MDIKRLTDFNGGWFVGDFEPSLLKTHHFEVCYKFHKQGELWPVHTHKVATEINYLARGTMIIQGRILETGDIFILRPGEVSDPKFLTDCEVVIIKTPSIPGDKYEVSNE
jgi:quercetin dioxygenase-like cupin family protein